MCVGLALTGQDLISQDIYIYVWVNIDMTNKKTSMYVTPLFSVYKTDMPTSIDVRE